MKKPSAAGVLPEAQQYAPHEDAATAFIHLRQEMPSQWTAPHLPDQCVKSTQKHIAREQLQPQQEMGSLS